MTNTETWKWWQSMRINYNKWLVISGMFSFVVYTAIVWLFPNAIPEAEITAFTVILQGTAYLLAMAAANIFYYLGPISEIVAKPSNPMQFRRITYGLGKWFSVGLPVCIPVLALVAVVSSQNA